MQNVEIRESAKAKGVMLWEIADAIGITDATFSRKLRKELSADERSRILEKIEEVARRKKGA